LDGALTCANAPVAAQNSTKLLTQTLAKSIRIITLFLNILRFM
jgi:hypothetical protein